MSDPFRPYHRARARRAAVRAAVALALAIGATAGVVAWGAAVPGRGPTVTPQPVAAGDAAGAGASGGAAGDGVGAGDGAGAPAEAGAGQGEALPAAVAAGAPGSAPVSDPVLADPDPSLADPSRSDPDPSLAETGPLEIRIDAAGHQAEIDQCLWVRMDFSMVDAPVVGAHNYCGGGVVLDLRTGDAVTLSGFELDGEYVVTGDRAVPTGENAAVATAGLVADVILQTCFWGDDTTRLVTLARV